MANQASVNGRGTACGRGSTSPEVDGVAGFVDDLASLAELQAELAAHDFRDALRKSRLPVALTLLGLVLVAGGTPVGLLGAGWLLADVLKIHQGWAMILTAGAAMTVGGVAAILGGRRLGHSFDSFRRSRKQLTLNLAWVRTVLVTKVRPHSWHRWL